MQGKLLRDLGLFTPIRAKIQSGMPVLATCAGMILLAEEIEGQEVRHLATMPVTVRRNAYGRQLGSFHGRWAFEGLGEIPMTFIRAPYLTRVDASVAVLARVEGRVVAAQYKNQLALAFHPELDDDLRLHRRFLSLCEGESHSTAPV